MPEIPWLRDSWHYCLLQLSKMRLYGHVIALSIARCSTIFYLLVQIIAIRIQYNNAGEVLHRKFSNCLRSEIFICNYFRIFD